MSLPFVNLTGSPYEQGYQHGQQLKERINHNFAVYLQYFEKEGLSRSEVLVMAQHYAVIIEAQNKDYYHNMQGIAVGATIPFAHIVVLNIRYEIIYQLFNNSMMAEAQRSDGCTAFAVLPSSPDNHLLMGQNWDWLPSIAGTILQTQESTGLKTLAFSEAGIVGGKIGLNTLGLGLAINGLHSTEEKPNDVTKPFHVCCYEILRQSSINDAVSVVTSSQRSYSANFLIAQTPDQLSNIEASSKTVNILGWQQGYFVHSNHFLDPDSCEITEPDSEFYVSSYARCERMNQLLRSTTTVNVASIQTYLQDHHNTPNSICSHENLAIPKNMRIQTLASVVMDLHQQSFSISDGIPCENDYQHFQL